MENYAHTSSVLCLHLNEYYFCIGEGPERAIVATESGSAPTNFENFY